MFKYTIPLFAALFCYVCHAQVANRTTAPAPTQPRPIPASTTRTTTTTTPRPTTPTAPPPPDETKKPPFSVWPLKYIDKRRHIYADYLLNGNWGSNSRPLPEDPERGEYEYEGYDGWYNNLAKPDLGIIDGALLRRWPAAYEDGTYLPSGSDRPNPLELSDKLLSGGIGSSSISGRNALLVFFGQQVVEEILDAQRAACPPEYFNIKIPENHQYHLITPNHTEMPVLRSRYDQRTGYSPNNPRQQLNEITPYIDGGLFYGITKQWSDQLRTYQNGSVDENGCLASATSLGVDLFPEYNTDRLPMANPPPPFYHGHYTQVHETAKVNRFFKLGNPRGNENAYLLTFGIMWFRWHNYLARRLRYHHPDWTSEKVYNEARKWVIATQQRIYVYEWLPTWINRNLPPYRGYDPSVDPQIDQFFQTTAFRFGHTLVVPGVYLRDYIRKNCTIGNNGSLWRTIRTCNIFWRGHEPLLNKTVDGQTFNDIDRILMGMSVMLSEKEDHEIVEDLRGNVFGPLEFPRRDLMAINIQRARDHGMPDFNSARRAFGLAPYTDFSNFTFINESIRDTLRELYKGDINKIDPWIGGILETNSRSGTPGELFGTVILDQFQRIRNGDRFWFENPNNNLFTPEEIERINSTSIYDIIMAVTQMDADDIPKFPFRAATQNVDINLIQRCNLRPINQFFALQQLNQDNLAERCKQGDSYDYFSNSEVSYILTFAGIGAFIAATGGFVYMIIRMKEKKANLSAHVDNEIRRRTLRESQQVRYPMFIVNEYVGVKEPLRKVVVILNSDKSSIFVQTFSGTLLRALDFSTQVNFVIQIYAIYDEPTTVIKCRHNYDLVLKFESEYLRDNFMKDFDTFIGSKQIMKKELIKNFNWNAALRIIETKAERQKLLEMFFRVTFAQAFQIQHSKQEMLKVDKNIAKEIVDTELTISEFADSLSMKADNEFVNRMFTLIDKDKNGFISYREFVDLLIIFANGTEEQKAKLLFDMYDIDGTGFLKSEDFVTMIRSFLETVGGRVEEKDIQQTINVMLKSAGVDHKTNLDFDDFKKIIGDDIKNLNNARLGFKGVKSDPNNYLSTAKDTIENIYESKQEIETRFKGLGANPQEQSESSKIIDDTQEEIIRHQNDRLGSSMMNIIFRFIELHSKEIFWYSLYTMVLLAIFAERAYYYSVEREHSGLRRIAGHGVTVTRGAASAMMFTYSSLFVTMSRNTITYLRDTVANKFFPFDASVEIHKYIAYWALVFTLIHVIGHAFNFYHISTQTAEDLTCLFRNYFRSTHVLPKFHYWCWETMTGFTGVVLTIIVGIMYIFAQSIVRRKIYNWFWYTHNLYPIFFIFFVLHGTGRLIQRPITYYFLLGPVVLFAVDTLISISRKKIEIPVTKAEILPSNVTMLQFRKPENFQYKAGQWVRIACIELNKSEYHPFTLSSAPEEDHLTVHIRAVGPWTNNIRGVYDSSRIDKHFPKIYLDGPYGEGHQDWNSYDVAILIGGGIGVTPFASILKDVAFKANRARTHCQKVYFIWVSRTQKQFEWLVDIIREVESKDLKNFVSCHIFITQFYEKFDLRTIMLYICERHYQRVSNKSLFTNLRAVTHFGRPAFPQFFKTVQSIHSNAKRVGVFSCGPPSMTSSVDQACGQINRHSVQRFEHHFKNF